MRHLKTTPTLDRKAAPRKALLRTLTISLVKHERITTTPAKARAVKTIIEPLITRGKTKSVHTMRLIEQKLSNKEAARTIVNVLSPRFMNRAGGYTRMMKVAPRRGDGAEQVILELLSEK